MTPRILGTGYAVPAKIRTNDDPVFAWLSQHQPLKNPFSGYVERRVLDHGETLADLMVPAAREAMKAAKIGPDDVDLLLGCGSVSTYFTPNDLSLLHQRLNLRDRTWVVPLANEFSNFAAGLYFADGLLKAGRIRHALIAVGSNWTRFVDYRTPQSASASDGAGAAVLGMSDVRECFAIIDQETVTQSQYYGSMFMLGKLDQSPQGRSWSDPTFTITELGQTGYGKFGQETAPLAVHRLLERNGIAADEIGLIGHQSSQSLLEAWEKSLKLDSKQIINTLEKFANMTVANTAVTLAYASENRQLLRYRYLVLLSLGPDMHANALLLARDGLPDRRRGA